MSMKLKLGAITAEDIASVTDGHIERFGNGGSGIARAFSKDSREEGTDILFAAIPGERFDGHDFIADAVRGGASIVLCSRVPQEATSLDFTAVVVADPVRALGILSAAYAKRIPSRTVAVTGSVGKTTTKEFISAVLSEKFSTHKTEGNLNNEIGLPMTLLSTPEKTEFSVLEMGMSSFGEIEYLSRLAEPEFAVITNIGTAHLEHLGSRENICKAKMEIISGLSPDGHLIINGDEPLLTEHPDLPKNCISVSVYNRNADLRAVNIRQTAENVTFDLICENRVLTNIEIPTVGQHNVYNALFAYAIGSRLGMTDAEIRKGLSNFRGVDMRQHISEVAGITVINDAYNASPESMRAALDVLASVAKQKGGRAAALLGDMRELGDQARLLHYQLGMTVAQKKVELLFTYGTMAENIAQSAIERGLRAENVHVNLNCDDPQTSADMILGALRPGDVLLVKASRAVQAERVIACMEQKKTRKKESTRKE